MSTEPAMHHAPVPWYRGRVALVLAGALGLGAIAAVAAFVVFRLLSGDPAGPIVHAEFLPADTVVYLELDLEPEGTQAAALDALTERLGAVGGGEGAAQLLGPLVEGFTAGSYSYERDVDPWFDGHAAFAVLDWGSLGFGGLLMPFPGDTTQPGAVVVLGVEDRAAVTRLTDRLEADAREAGLGFVSREVDGWTLWHADAATSGGTGVAFAVGDDLLVLGTRDTDLDVVRELHDEGGDTLADDGEFRGEVARLPEERVATLYSRAGALRDGLIGASGILGLGELATLELLAGLLPLDQVGALVLEDDRIVLERWQPVGTNQPDEREMDRLSSIVPDDAQLYAELPEFGRLLSAIGAAVGRDARDAAGEMGGAEVARFEAVTGRPIDEVGDWLGDAAFGLTATQEGSLGFAGIALDAAAAGEVLDGVTQLLAMTGAPVREAEVDGRPVVRLDVPFLFGSITIEYALVDDAVLLGLEGFTEWLLADVSRLGDDPGYASALEEAQGARNAGVVYLPVSRWLEQLRADPASLPADWDEVEPRLAAVRDAIMLTFVDGDRVRSRLEIRLTQP